MKQEMMGWQWPSVANPPMHMVKMLSGVQFTSPLMLHFVCGFDSKLF